MNNTQVEATLLALGPRLTWKRTENGGFEEWMSVPQDATGPLYLVTDVLAFGENPHEVDPAHRFEARSLFGDSTNRYPTANAAKAACERHSTTGSWESL